MILDDTIRALRGFLDAGAVDAYRRHLAPDIAPAVRGEDELAVTWLGNAGIAVSDGTHSLVIDPFVSRPSLFAVASGRPLLPRRQLVSAWAKRLPPNVGAVIASHSHYDHAMDAPFFARAVSAPLVGSSSTIQIGRGAGLPADLLREVAPGDTLDHGRFRVRFLASRHGPALFGRIPYPGLIARPLVQPRPVSAFRLGETFGLVIEHPGGTIVHHGSAGWLPGMYDGVRADAVCLCLAGRAATAPYLAAVVDATRAPRVFPIHFDDMFRPVDEALGMLPLVDLPEFLATARATRPSLSVTTLPVGRPVLLPRAADGRPAKGDRT